MTPFDIHVVMFELRRVGGKTTTRDMSRILHTNQTNRVGNTLRYLESKGMVKKLRKGDRRTGSAEWEVCSHE